MSYTDQDLKAEIGGIVTEILDATSSGEVKADWVAIAVIAANLDEFEKNSDFTSNAVWGHVRKMVGAYIRSLKIDPTDPMVQGVLAGFERLQMFYEVERPDGATVRVVRVQRNMMTTRERRLEADMLIRCGQSQVDHGNQFHRETDELIAAGLLEPDAEE